MQHINFYRNKVAINVLAKDIANAREIYDAAEGHAVIGILSAQFSSVEEGVLEVKRWMNDVPSISVGLGAGDPAQYYKAAMIDTEKNVFGFMCDSSYMVFCYDEEKGFENVFTENLGDSYYGYSYNGLQEVRGCFIGDNFYLVGGGQIRIYDMANDYKEVGRLEL